jgi:pyruvate dehydrogenase E2 component (dihydrolipoamide acetyltransferase)
MAEIVTMPKLGFDMAEGTLVRWVVAEGEPVKKGGVLAEIETDKATVEVESAYEGVVVRHLVEEGTPVPIGDPIAVVGAQGEQVDVNQLLPQQPGEKGAEQTTPGGGGGKDTAQNGPGSAAAPTAETGLRPDAPTEDQEALPRPSAVEEAQPQAQGAQPREQADARPAQPEVGVSEPSPDGGGLPGGVRASPVARRMAEEMNIDLRRVKGSGPDGRITKADIEAYQEAPAPAPERQAEPAPVAAPPAPAPAPAAPSPAPAPVAYGQPREDRRMPVSRLRAAIGRRMVQSKQQAPHFYVTHEYDVAALMDLRVQVNGMLPEGEKTSLNDFIVKAAALTLRQFPNLNAALDEKTNEVIHYGHINISNAVAVEGGLLTVVVKDADLKPIRQISAEIKSMAGRAREGKVRTEDIEGSTFSLSNLGMYDVESFVAVLNPPEAGILAIGSAREVPIVENGELKVGQRMKVTLSVDHRVSDGAEGARFLQAMAEYIEKPMLVLV